MFFETSIPHTILPILTVINSLCPYKNCYSVKLLKGKFLVFKKSSVEAYLDYKHLFQLQMNVLEISPLSGQSKEKNGKLGVRISWDLQVIRLYQLLLPEGCLR